MNPPSILLDLSYLIAVQDPEHDEHEEAVRSFGQLIDDFVAQRCLLVGRADHLDAVGDPDLFAVVDKLHIARQHRNAAKTMVARNGVGIDEAITLVLVKRYRIRTVATFDQRFDRYDIGRIPPRVEADAGDTPAATNVAD